MTVAVIIDDRCLQHDTGPTHPERPDRLRVLLDLAQHLDPATFTVAPISRSVTREEAGRVHTAHHLDQLDLVRNRRGYFDADTPFSEKSVDLAYLAAGGAIQAVESVCRGDHSAAFALIRPPGHHAEADEAMGFCFLNNIAIATEHAIQALGKKRVLIVDWDVHHGNGTQHIFEERDDVLFFSVHQWPQYPGTGAKHERGRGKGEGFTINVPLPAGCGNAEYFKAFDDVLAPAAKAFNPDVVLVSAGFDAHEDDPLGGMRITSDGFSKLCGRVKAMAGDAPLALILEGGYSLRGLKESVAACLNVLATSLSHPRNFRV